MAGRESRTRRCHQISRLRHVSNGYDHYYSEGTVLKLRGAVLGAAVLGQQHRFLSSSLDWYHGISSFSHRTYKFLE